MELIMIYFGFLGVIVLLYLVVEITTTRKK